MLKVKLIRGKIMMKMISPKEEEEDLNANSNDIELKLYLN